MRSLKNICLSRFKAFAASLSIPRQGGIPGFAVSVLTALMLPGCYFTGVESTPRITAREVKREAPLPSADDFYLASVTQKPLADWTRGKRFIITDSRVERIFGASASALRGSDPTGMIITWEDARELPSPTGSTLTDLDFLTPSGDRLTYRVNRPLSRLMTDSVTEVPFTIQLSAVSEADSIMRGRDFWTLTALWRDDDDTPVKGRKFVRVHIDSVAPGNQIFPLKVAFTDESGRSARLFIHPGAKTQAPRTFSHVFSTTDPRNRYLHISPEHWALIIDSRIAEGMTTEECRLALGSPKEIERGATNSFLREAWLYDNGVWLLFEDGLLKRFRR